MAALKPGALGSRSDVDTPTEFVSSMAAEMDAALSELLDEEDGKPLVTGGNSSTIRKRRLLFVAIAQGLVRHLTANQGALVIKDATGTATGAWIDIQTD